MYEGRPAGFSMEAVNLGKTTDPSKRLDLSHRIRHISLYERYLRLWYRIVDYCISWIPESIQTWLWFPTLGPRYLQRRKLLIAQQNETGENHLRKEDKGMMLLYFLGTLPEYERKGIGSTLLKGTLARAEEDGTAVYLGATKAGKPLYDRNGFEIIVQEQKGDPEDVSWIETIMRWSSPEL
jgi:ribosomal protein S18 acetylase RimI-like enzyme